MMKLRNLWNKHIIQWVSVTEVSYQWCTFYPDAVGLKMKTTQIEDIKLYLHSSQKHFHEHTII